jgi:hypothetical protein
MGKAWQQFSDAGSIPEKRYRDDEITIFRVNVPGPPMRRHAQAMAIANRFHASALLFMFENNSQMPAKLAGWPANRHSSFL